MTGRPAGWGRASRASSPLTTDPKRIVEQGYDAIADRFGEWQAKIRGSPRMRYLDALLERLPAESDLLELGCGSGVASTQLLARRGRLTCVDVSGEQLRRAQREIGAATFLHADVADVRFPPRSFDAVVGFYVINHLPQAEQRRLPAHVFEWLRPGGYFVASYAASEPHERVVDAWLGVPMFFASLGVDENRALLCGAGFRVLADEIVTEQEPDGEASFQWLLARKPEVP